MKRSVCIYIIVMLTMMQYATAQDSAGYWHNKVRTIRYQPAGEDFVIINGNRKFTRALYGTHTAFRVETGDVPEFALYLPGMGGNIKIGIIKNNRSKWLSEAGNIKASYKPGSRSYELKDSLLGSGKIMVTVLAAANTEGVIIKTTAYNIGKDIQLVWAYGGVTGKKFSRDGDMGPDPESVFYMKPEYCRNNVFTSKQNEFSLEYGGSKPQFIYGISSPSIALQVADAAAQDSPIQLLQSKAGSTPVISGILSLNNNTDHFLLIAKQDSSAAVRKDLVRLFEEAETARTAVAGRIKVTTPDPYINTLGAAISVAADAIWEAPSFMHGAIGWRMRLNGWRGAYAADVLGWHDRARMHFRAYAKSQLTSPGTGPVISDTALNLARQLEKLGTSLFSSGYICRNPNGDFRPHHYDMNLVFIDQLLWHFNWTGDTVFVKEMWPLLQRHLAWEKRNFDPDNDGLYDAYAAIWASDALQYSGGAVTHSSAYNYRANKMAAMLASMIGEDATPYKTEAGKILNAVNDVLWMKDKGVYAEFKDALGLRQLHPHAALWTLYHSLDSDIADPFQAYQSMEYINNSIPHIPVRAKGLADGFYTISTSNWMPYTWSLNNVALAELMHTTLAYWQAGKNEEAFQLWKSALVESMYLGGSPGNFQQISTYDAARGEAYRDFADPVGMTARSLVQGLFGILPDALQNKILIRPGFPQQWNNASLQTPDIDFNFKRTGKKDEYIIRPSLAKQLNLELLVKANGTGIKRITVNNKKATWKNIADAIGRPMISIPAGSSNRYAIIIEWEGNPVAGDKPYRLVSNSTFNYSVPGASLQKLWDPQELFATSSVNTAKLSAKISGETGVKTAFVQVKEGAFTYWKAINASIVAPLELVYETEQQKNKIRFSIKNNSNREIAANISVNNFSRVVNIAAGSMSKNICVDSGYIVPGSNAISVKWNNLELEENIINWNVDVQNNPALKPVNLQSHFNDKVSNIFRNKYLSPRPAVPTLQLPVQGIGDWTHPMLAAAINDAGLRKNALNDTFHLPQHIYFNTPADSNRPNIVFTSQWDNYPSQVSIPLNGNASHAYFLMAGSTNPMQSQLVNGIVSIQYTDGSTDILLLRNPGSWWPIEQDYLQDGYAFNTKAARPVRVHLKTGNSFSSLNDPLNLFNGKTIDGGAATVLDLPLNKNKTLQSLRLQTTANDVVIGLMGITLLL